MRISNFVIGIILFSLFIGVFGLVISEVGNNYSLSTDNINFTKFQRLNELSNHTQKLDAQSGNVSPRSGVLDILGNFLTSGYQALITTKESVTIFNDMTDEAVKEANLGDAGNLFKNAIIMIVLVLIVLTVLLTAVVKIQL